MSSVYQAFFYQIWDKGQQGREGNLCFKAAFTFSMVSKCLPSTSGQHGPFHPLNYTLAGQKAQPVHKECPGAAGGSACAQRHRCPTG